MSRPSPEIVILSHAQDEHALAVLSELPADSSPFLLDLSHAGSDFTATRGTDNSLWIATRAGDNIGLNHVGVWWNRRPRIVGFPKAKPTYRTAQEVELEEFWTGTMGFGLPGLWCNPFDAQRKIQYKIRQLHIAKDVGLSIPDTIWTNDELAVQAFLDKHSGNVIFKMFSGTEAVWQPCRFFDHNFLSKLEYVRFSPSIFQEFIAGAAEYRVTIFGEHCFAARADVGNSRFPSDVRIDLKTRRFASTIDDKIVSKLRQFMARSGLVFATFDMREDKDGRIFFLEANPMGQFLYVDNVFHGEVLKSFCRFLRACARVQAPPPPTGPLPLPHNSTQHIDFSKDLTVPIYEAAGSWATHIMEE